MYFHVVIFSAHEKGVRFEGVMFPVSSPFDQPCWDSSSRCLVRFPTHLCSLNRKEAESKLCFGAALHHRCASGAHFGRSRVRSTKTRPCCPDQSPMRRSASPFGARSISNRGDCCVDSALPACTQAAASLLLRSLQPGFGLPAATPTSRSTHSA